LDLDWTDGDPEASAADVGAEHERDQEEGQACDQGRVFVPLEQIERPRGDRGGKQSGDPGGEVDQVAGADPGVEVARRPERRADALDHHQAKRGQCRRHRQEHLVAAESGQSKDQADQEEETADEDRRLEVGNDDRVEGAVVGDGDGQEADEEEERGQRQELRLDPADARFRPDHDGAALPR
jgi:hypothetical protein